MELVTNLGVGIALALGFYMAFSIGANDVANAMGTSVGSRVLTLRQAIIIAAIFEFLGAFIAGADVTSTIQGGILDPDVANAAPQLVKYGMLAALASAGTWDSRASRGSGSGSTWRLSSSTHGRPRPERRSSGCAASFWPTQSWNGITSS